MSAKCQLPASAPCITTVWATLLWVWGGISTATCLLLCVLFSTPVVLAGCLRTVLRICLGYFLGLLLSHPSSFNMTHLNYLKQLLAVYAATPIDIIQFKIPAKLLLHSSLQHQAQSGYILHKINEAILKKKRSRTSLTLSSANYINFFWTDLHLYKTSNISFITTETNAFLFETTYDRWQGREYHSQLVSMHMLVVHM